MGKDFRRYLTTFKSWFSGAARYLGKVVNDTPLQFVQPGVLLRERVRGIPSNLTSKVGIDSSLDAEKDKAETALQGVKRIEVVPITQQNVVDYILGRITEDDFHEFQEQGISNVPPVGAIALFTTGRELIPDSFGLAGETVEQAVQQRLRSRLKSLLVGRLLHLLVTEGSSSPKVTITIRPVDTTSGRGNKEFQWKQVEPTVQLPAGTDIQIQVKNNENRNLYISIVLIDSSGTLNVLFPLNWDAPEDAALVAYGNTITVPTSEDKFKFHLRGPSGTLEVLVLASVNPLRNALRGLKNIARSRKVERGSAMRLLEDESVEVIENLFQDLDEMSRAGIDIISKNVQAVDLTKLAGISVLIDVVE